MQWVKVDDAFFTKCNSCGANSNNQLLYNEKGRPTVLLVNLKYKDNHYDFVVPMKSNISDAEDKNNYFALNASDEEILDFNKGISEVVKIMKLEKYGFKIISNAGKFTTPEFPEPQSVMHMHIHILGKSEEE